MAKVSSSPQKSKCKTTQKTKQSVYRVRNWSEYNHGLKQRGSLTFWFDEKVIKAWNIKAQNNVVHNMCILTWPSKPA